MGRPDEAEIELAGDLEAASSLGLVHFFPDLRHRNEDIAHRASRQSRRLAVVHRSRLVYEGRARGCEILSAEALPDPGPHALGGKEI